MKSKRNGKGVIKYSKSDLLLVHVQLEKQGGDYGDSYMERVEDSENQKWLLREQGSQHSYQMLNQSNTCIIEAYIL